MLFKVEVNNISPERLTGFFVNWLNPPSPNKHLKLLQNSDKCVIAIDENTNRVVGFVTAITDGVLSAYIPLLEVLPEYQKSRERQGISSKDFRRTSRFLYD